MVIIQEKPTTKTGKSMLKADVLNHYRTQVAIAKAAGITQAAVSKWPDVVPEGSAYKLESVSSGALKVDKSLYAAPLDKAS